MAHPAAVKTQQEAHRASGRFWFFLAFYPVVLAAWVLLYLWSREHLSAVNSSGLSGLLLVLDPAALAALCLAPAEPASLPSIIAMWSLMSLAMMLPTAVPMVTAYADMSASQPARIPRHHLWIFIGGYLSVWLGFSICAAGMQFLLAQWRIVTEHGLSISPPLTIGLLTVAGLYQFTALKASCLTKCRSPLGFFMSHWREGAAGAYRMGARHGAHCLGCCWALMLLAFAGGTMNIAWMGIATVLMAVEKFPGIGRYITKPLGVLLLCLAAYLIFATLN